MSKYSRCKVKFIDNKMDNFNLSQQMPNTTTREKVAVFFGFSGEKEEKNSIRNENERTDILLKNMPKKTTPYQWNANDYHRHLIIRFIQNHKLTLSEKQGSKEFVCRKTNDLLFY